MRSLTSSPCGGMQVKYSYGAMPIMCREHEQSLISILESLVQGRTAGMPWKRCSPLPTRPLASPGASASFPATKRGLMQQTPHQPVVGSSRPHSPEGDQSRPSCRCGLYYDKRIGRVVTIGTPSGKARRARRAAVHVVIVHNVILSRWLSCTSHLTPSQIEAFEPTSEEQVDLVAVSLWRPDMVTGMVELDRSLKVMKADAMAAAALGHTLPSLYGRNLSRCGQSHITGKMKMY